MKSQVHLMRNLQGSETFGNLDISEYDYFLPDEKIAQFPLEERDMSKLMISSEKGLSDDIFRNIDKYISNEHLLVFNNSKVVRARIYFKKETGALIEVFCIEPVSPADYESSFNSKGQVIWKCIIGNLKKWKSGRLLKYFPYNGFTYEFSAEKINSQEDTWEIRFTWNNNDLTFSEVLELIGHIPLPPYITREDKEEDVDRYQTIYAHIKGSVAAPTAGLHFTESVFNKLHSKGVMTAEITLHVGAGTFQPIKTKRIAAHDMHSEHFTISEKTIEKLINNKGRIIAVGTTSVRTIESLYWIGLKLFDKNLSQITNVSLDQWEPYTISNSSHTPEESLGMILKFLKFKKANYLTASTKIIIIPGYEFKITNGIITNFHQPKSTLLLLVSAWTGNKWKEIYDYALKKDFRFLSYGDCSLLFRQLNT
jgi:S-adenosylmethionine:tRNA ribosyltransferase-isomerase